MGTFRYTIAIGSPTREHFEEIQPLVDTGAAFTWVPAPILERLGHKPTFRRRLRLADGGVVERGAAEVPVRIGDEVMSTLCIFGDEGSECLLGAMTLEQFSLAPDPVNRTLVPIVTYMV